MYTGCNLKTMELLDCVLIWACVVIRSNTVYLHKKKKKKEKEKMFIWILLLSGALVLILIALFK